MIVSQNFTLALKFCEEKYYKHLEKQSNLQSQANRDDKKNSRQVYIYSLEDSASGVQVSNIELVIV
jgi:hypothetical protein